jgi:hypothetical protein
LINIHRVRPKHVSLFLPLPLCDSPGLVDGRRRRIVIFRQEFEAIF